MGCLLGTGQMTYYFEFVSFEPIIPTGILTWCCDDWPSYRSFPTDISACCENIETVQLSLRND